jgi:hypothetical protein
VASPHLQIELLRTIGTIDGTATGIGGIITLRHKTSQSCLAIKLKKGSRDGSPFF